MTTTETKQLFRTIINWSLMKGKKLDDFYDERGISSDQFAPVFEEMYYEPVIISEKVSEPIIIANKVFIKPVKNDSNIQTVQIEFIKGNKIGEYHDLVIRIKALRHNGDVVYEISESFYDSTNKTYLCDFSVKSRFNDLSSLDFLTSFIINNKDGYINFIPNVYFDDLSGIAEDINNFIQLSFGSEKE